MNYPVTRLRRLRASKAVRGLAREATLSVDDLILPYFIEEGLKEKREVPSMPGVFRFPVKDFVRDVHEAAKNGVGAILLFGIPKKKDEKGSEAYNDKGIVQEAIRAVKKDTPDVLVMTDVCVCEYTSHGHCGIVRKKRGGGFVLENDASLALLEKMSVSHARAGADFVAPSAMMDGQVGAIRSALDEAGFTDRGILAYSAKYASSFYGPFRDAADSPPAFGDRKTYQMDPANAEEALREVQQDIDEGADIVMVKPALAYLDVIRLVKEAFPVPLAAYNVSGEYAAVKAAGQKEWLDEEKVALEILLAIKRAGADMIITYFAKKVKKWLNE
jgi:porphobilinogen synthase